MQPCSMSESPCRSNSSGAASYLDGEPTESTRAMPSTNQHRAHPPGSSPARCSIPTAWRPHDDMRAPQHRCVLKQACMASAGMPSTMPCRPARTLATGNMLFASADPQPPSYDALPAVETRWPLDRLSWQRARVDGPAGRYPARSCAATQVHALPSPSQAQHALQPLDRPGRVLFSPTLRGHAGATLSAAKAPAHTRTTPSPPAVPPLEAAHPRPQVREVL